VTKVGQNGSYKNTRIWLDQGKILGEWRIYWNSKHKKSNNWLVVTQCSLVEGLGGNGFNKPLLQKAFAEKEHLAFSVVSQIRSLDVVVGSEYHYRCWIYELKRLGIWDDAKYDLYEQTKKSAPG